MSSGVISRGVNQGQVTYQTFNPRDFTQDKHRTVDDRPYGGGAGMVMLYEPLARAIQAAREAGPAGTQVVYLSPQGQVVNQALINRALNATGYVFVCGRYEGLDQRIVDELVDAQWSIGDYVLSGGEIPALAVADSIVRLIPGVLGNNLSIIDESFLDDQLDYPHYTRPENIGDLRVPDALLSGDHRRIAEYRRREALTRTYLLRPDLMTQKVFSAEEVQLLRDNLIR